MKNVYIYDLTTIDPPFEKLQSKAMDWLSRAYARYQNEQTHSLEDYKKLLKRVACGPQQIFKRKHFLKDFVTSPEESWIFKSEKQSGASERQIFFQESALNVCSAIYEKRSMPEHLIHVTCTGYVSPSAAQIVAAKKNLDTVVTHCYHMGCYGAFPALRMASGILFSGAKNVDVIHTELCTLHLNPKDPSLEQMVIQSLFADGACVYRLGQDRPHRGFELLSRAEFIVPDSASAMEWRASDLGMSMGLSKDVPSLISNALKSTMLKWQEQSQLPLLQELKNAIVVVHPGGPKIIDSVKQILELSDSQIEHSKKVLFERGNMSSATVPHIWEEILKDESIQNGQMVISMAFGPGLTICFSLSRVIK